MKTDRFSPQCQEKFYFVLEQFSYFFLIKYCWWNYFESHLYFSSLHFLEILYIFNKKKNRVIISKKSLVMTILKLLKFKKIWIINFEKKKFLAKIIWIDLRKSFQKTLEKEILNIFSKIFSQKFLDLDCLRIFIFSADLLWFLNFQRFLISLWIFVNWREIFFVLKIKIFKILLWFRFYQLTRFA